LQRVARSELRWPFERRATAGNIVDFREQYAFADLDFGAAVKPVPFPFAALLGVHPIPSRKSLLKR
jgi:hypothetical protein